MIARRPGPAGSAGLPAAIAAAATGYGTRSGLTLLTGGGANVNKPDEIRARGAVVEDEHDVKVARAPVRR